MLKNNLTGSVLRICGTAECNGHTIGLVVTFHKLNQPRGFPDADRQQTICKRIQCAGMTDLLHTGQLA